MSSNIYMRKRIGDDQDIGGEEQEGRFTKRHKESSGDNGYVGYLD